MNRSSMLLSVLAIGLAGSASAATPIQPQFVLDHFHQPLQIDNWLSPMFPGSHVIFHELEDGECKVNDVVVTRAVKSDFQGDYAGLSARPVRDKVWDDPKCNGTRGLLLENTTDWYGEDNSGNVWYFGEDTVEYTYDDAGNRTSASTEGSWEAGRRGAKAGIVMPAKPVDGLYYRQEYEAGVAEDNALVEKVGMYMTTPLGRFSNCVKTRETTPLSPGDVEYKYYCPNVGLVFVSSPVVHGGATAVDLGLH